MDSINDLTNALVKQITDNFLLNLKKEVAKQISDNVAFQMSRLDIPTLVREHLSNVLNSSAKTYNFPKRSIHGSSIDPDGLFIKADQISSGIIRNFESTGIQDQSTSTQVTIIDNATVFENQLVAKELHVAGDSVIQGNLTISGNITRNTKLFDDLLEVSKSAILGELGNGMLSDMQESILNHINTNGLSADVIKYQNHRLIRDNTLAPSILFSNLQKVGALRELQVVGETLLDETVYISNHRLGINTMDPEETFDLWDQEVEVTISKLEKDVGIVETPKNQTLVISANKNYNIVCNTDGTVTINNLKIGKSNHSSSDELPTTDMPKGNIVWNTNPHMGGPIGWVSLGGARWASFGTITA
jgi:hypothetical protein